jgi:class 3 adenylate cyclase
MPDMQIEKSPELEAVFRRVWQAFEDGSLDALSNLLSSHPDVLFILSDAANWITGSDNLVRVMAGRSTRMGVDRVELDRVQAHQIGDFGWAAAVVTAVRSSGESATFRSTMTAAVLDGVWKVVQVHTSVGVSDEETYGYELAAGLKELVESLSVNSAEEIAEVAGPSGTVTLVFTDIEDSTRLGQQRGDSVWSRDIQSHFDAVSKVVADNDGKVIKTLGDGTMAAFPTARNATDAAIGIERMGTDNEIRVRIGIHTGEAISVGDDYAGLAVAKAARIASAAAGGEILVSSATRELISRFDYQFDSERVAELKGIDGSHRIYPLIWVDTP